MSSTRSEVAPLLHPFFFFLCGPVVSVLKQHLVIIVAENKTVTIIWIVVGFQWAWLHLLWSPLIYFSILCRYHYSIIANIAIRICFVVQTWLYFGVWHLQYSAFISLTSSCLYFTSRLFNLCQIGSDVNGQSSELAISRFQEMEKHMKIQNQQIIQCIKEFCFLSYF